MPDELLTVKDVAGWLRLNPQTVRNWIDRGDLEAVRVGSRRVRIARSELERFVRVSKIEIPARPQASRDPLGGPDRKELGSVRDQS